MQTLRENGHKKSMMETIKTILMVKKNPYIIPKIIIGFICINTISNIISYFSYSKTFLIQNKWSWEALQIKLLNQKTRIIN